MTAVKHMLLVVTGLKREARIAAGDGIVTFCSGSKPELLHQRLLDFFSARPRESGDPAQESGIPAGARARAAQNADPDTGMNGGEICGILSFGLAGGLAPNLQPGDVVLATHVTGNSAHYDATFDWHDAMALKLEGAVRLHRGLIAGMDNVLSKSADKAALHAASGALAVDTESHVAAAFAQQHRLPFAALRAVSDAAARSLPKIAAHALKPDGAIDLVQVLADIARSPGQVPALVATGIDSERAFAALRRSRRLLGPLFGLGSAKL